MSGLGYGAAVVIADHVTRSLVIVVLCSLAAAAAYGTAATLQHEVAAAEPSDLGQGAGLLLRLARRPRWLVGNGLDLVGYVFQFLALRRGSLALVEPILVLSLVVALPLTARIERRRLTGTDVAWTGTIVGGLALFLAVGQPGLGRPSASTAAWVVLTAAIAVTTLGLVLGARSGSGARPAVLLAAASGVTFGYVAAVTSRTGFLLGSGLVHTLETPAPYALAVSAAAALLLTQHAFSAGALRLSLPTLTVTQPLVAVAIGIWFFGEHIRTAGAAPYLEVLGLLLVTVGVFGLASAEILPAGADSAPPGRA